MFRPASGGMTWHQAWVPAAETALPLVCDSPHSGCDYPDDFDSCQPLTALRQVEDSHVDALWAGAPAVGASLLAARFPRSYIDANRELDDLDAGLLDASWPLALRPGLQTRQGHGLIWRQLGPGQPLYRRPLTVAEVQGRIEQCWRPYREALWAALQAAWRRHGKVWHLNLHSMPAQRGVPADVVLGDRDGRSCEPALTALVEAQLRAEGLSVARNRPYKGAALVAWAGAPDEGRHSLQIELRRGLYMNERTREPHAGFAPLRAALDRCLRALAARLEADLSPPAVDKRVGKLPTDVTSP